MSADTMIEFGRMIAALVFVIALMGGFALLLKKLGLSGPNLPQTGRRRLKVVESVPLDARRRLVLVQCDESQHLVILGPGGETVIKTDIPANDRAEASAPLSAASPSPVDASGKS